MNRVAIYATPAPGSPLHRLAVAWLGRDAFLPETSRPAERGRDPLVAEPARYGFHATLRAPFRLRDGMTLDAVVERLAGFCAARSAPVISRLALTRLGAFWALCPDRPEPALAALEGDVLDTFEPCRAALDADEVARRRPERLSPRQRELLDIWGYPFVREEFRFHMTLTGPVEGAADDVRLALEAQFAPVLGEPLSLDGLGVFVEPTPGAAFIAQSFHPFGPSTVIEEAKP